MVAAGEPVVCCFQYSVHSLRSPGSPGQEKERSALLHTLGTVQALVSGSTQKPAGEGRALQGQYDVADGSNCQEECELLAVQHAPMQTSWCTALAQSMLTRCMHSCCCMPMSHQQLTRLVVQELSHACAGAGHIGPVAWNGQTRGPHTWHA